MKFKKALFSIALIFIFHPARGELNLIKSTENQPNQPYGQIASNSKIPLWISLEKKDNGEILKTTLSIREMNCNASDKVIRVTTNESYMTISMISQANEKRMAIASVDYLGNWKINNFNSDMSLKKNDFPLDEFGVVFSSITTDDGYFIAGIDKNKHPLLYFYDVNFKRKTKFKTPSSKSGEFYSISKYNDRIFAIFNEYIEKHSTNKELTSHLIEYSKKGILISKIKLKGKSATATTLSNGDIAVSYLIEKDIYIEKFKNDLSSQWTMKLHQRHGIASVKGMLLEVGKDIAWIGSNNNKLLVHRLGSDGTSQKSTTDTHSKINSPQPVRYAASAYGNELHIRGKAKKEKSTQFNNLTEFCIIEK